LQSITFPLHNHVNFSVSVNTEENEGGNHGRAGSRVRRTGARCSRQFVSTADDHGYPSRPSLKVAQASGDRTAARCTSHEDQRDRWLKVSGRDTGWMAEIVVFICSARRENSAGHRTYFQLSLPTISAAFTLTPVTVHIRGRL
jgi:hypothetical protein